MDKLQRVIAKSEMYDALVRYCRGVDRLEKDLILSAFHDGAYDDHGPYGTYATELAENLMEVKPRETLWSIHTIFNHSVEFVDDSTAISEVVLVSYQILKGQTAVQTFWGRYLDRFELRDDEWKIAFRKLVHDYAGTLEPGPWGIPSLPLDQMHQGGRGAADPASAAKRSALFPPEARS